MITLTLYNEQLTAEYAVRKSNQIILYDENYVELCRIKHVDGTTMEHITLDGEWTEPSLIPDKTDTLKANVDYCLMLLGEVP